MAKLTDRAAIVGEVLDATFDGLPETATAVRVLLADDTKTESVEATKSGNSWNFEHTPTEVSGKVRWFVEVYIGQRMGVAKSGTIYLRPVVSKYRAVVAAIENALTNWANNPNKRIQCGELSIEYKDRDDLLGILAYWRGRAEADENGTAAASGPRVLRGGF